MTESNMIDNWNYADHQKLIFERCNRFCNLYQCKKDEDELLIEAELAYVRATQTWQEGKIEFCSYLSVCVDRALKQFWKTWNRQPRGMGADKADRHQENKNERTDPADRHHFDFGGFLNEVSSDAREVISLVLKQEGGAAQNRHARKRLLKETLKDIGWTAGRIAQCWKEIREALS